MSPGLIKHSGVSRRECFRLIGGYAAARSVLMYLQNCGVFFFLKQQEYSTFSGNLWFNPSRSDVATTQLKLSLLIERENKKKRGFATTAKLLSNTNGSNSWELVV